VTRIVLSAHATERLVERWPNEPLEESAARACREVADALASGRMACRMPRILVPRGPRPRIHRDSGRARFVWSVDGRLVAVVKRVRVHDRRGGRLAVLVLTLFDPTEFTTTNEKGVAA
jgi:hypothetical protein